jgi:hypothetical protein
MKSTITVLSASLLTLALSGAAMAAPDLSPIYQSQVRVAPTSSEWAQAEGNALHGPTAASPASRPRLTAAQAAQECRVLAQRFDHRAAPTAMKSPATPQGALRAEGAMLCKSQPHAGDRYLRAAIATLNARLLATESKTHTT